MNARKRKRDADATAHDADAAALPEAATVVEHLVGAVASGPLHARQFLAARPR
jgi:hypothetical protein